jgi:hypothetical protein
MIRLATAIALLAAVAAPRGAQGHDLWLERAGDGFVLRSGHRGAEAVALDPARVKGIRCASGGAPPRDATGAARPAGGALRVEARCDAISAAVDHGFYVLTPDGERNVPRTQAPDAVRSWRSRQFAKWVDASSAAAATPLGDAFEIVPVTGLAGKRPGARVTVRVLLDGRPVPGAAVAIGHRVLAETSRAGEARIDVRSAGVETISATLRRPLGAPEAEVEVLEASLTFEVAR